jgi:hypothetical protein
MGEWVTKVTGLRGYGVTNIIRHEVMEFMGEALEMQFIRNVSKFK